MNAQEQSDRFRDDSSNGDKLQKRIKIDSGPCLALPIVNQNIPLQFQQIPSMPLIVPVANHNYQLKQNTELNQLEIGSRKVKLIYHQTMERRDLINLKIIKLCIVNYTIVPKAVSLEMHVIISMI